MWRVQAEAVALAHAAHALSSTTKFRVQQLAVRSTSF
jgi:hypothetical protein